jgi:hypothetical protein
VGVGARCTGTAGSGHCFEALPSGGNDSQFRERKKGVEKNEGQNDQQFGHEFRGRRIFV